MNLARALTALNILQSLILFCSLALATDTKKSNPILRKNQSEIIPISILPENTIKKNTASSTNKDGSFQIFFRCQHTDNKQEMVVCTPHSEKDRVALALHKYDKDIQFHLSVPEFEKLFRLSFSNVAGPLHTKDNLDDNHFHKKSFWIELKNPLSASDSPFMHVTFSRITLSLPKYEKKSTDDENENANNHLITNKPHIEIGMNTLKYHPGASSSFNQTESLALSEIESIFNSEIKNPPVFLFANVFADNTPHMLRMVDINQCFRMLYFMRCITYPLLIF